jgi:predicted amidohydrolase
MVLHEVENFPVQYNDVLVFPEYFANYCNRAEFYGTLDKYRKDDINYYVVGVGKSDITKYTSVFLLDESQTVLGIRRKISPFWGEATVPGLSVEAYELSRNRRLGIVICKEVLHTAIAEVYRMMNVSMIAVTIGSGDFWDMQRASWIDQMTLFSKICDAPLVCASGATKEEGGINLVIEP